MDTTPPSRVARRLAALLLAALLLPACDQAASPMVTAVPAPPTAAPLPAPSPLADTDACLARGAFPPLLAGLRYGVNAFLLHTDGQRVATLSRGAGFGWLRQQIHWRDIEIAPGAYSWNALDVAVAQARGAGLRLLLSIVRAPSWATANGGDGLPTRPELFAGFTHALAARYRGQVAAYEIWNEPNLAVENGGTVAVPAQYLAALRAAYPAIKAADPCALVVAAPLAATATDDPRIAAPDLRFYRELYALDGGAFLRAADIVGLHPGGSDHPFNAAWPPTAPEQSAQYFRHVERVRAIMQQAGDRRQAWITEVGWTATAAPGAPPPVGAAQQADNLAGALAYTRQHYPWVSAIFVWNLNFAVLGPPDDEKSAFAILNPDWSPRPAYQAIQAYLSDRAAADDKAAPRLSAGAPWRPVWQFTAAGKLRAPPVLAPDGTLYLAADPGMLYAIAPEGGLRWSYQTRGPTRAAPALAGGALYLGDEAGFLTALTLDGAVRWQRSLAAAVRSSPQLLGDGVAVATGSAVVRLAAAGTIVWRTELGAPARLLASSGALFAATTAGDVVRLSEDGRILWRTALGHPIASSPALGAGGRDLLIGDADGTLSALDATTGAVRWQRKLVERVVSPTLTDSSPLISAPPLVTADGAIFLGGRDGVVTALGPDGSVRWRYTTPSDISAPPVLSPAGLIGVGLYDERIIALDAAGQPRYEARVSGAVRSAPVFGRDGRLYVATLGGRLYAFAPITR